LLHEEELENHHGIFSITARLHCVSATRTEALAKVGLLGMRMVCTYPDCCEAKEGRDSICLTQWGPASQYTKLRKFASMQSGKTTDSKRQHHTGRSSRKT